MHGELSPPAELGAQLGTIGCNRKEIGGLEASPADQGAVDVGDIKQFLRVRRLDRAAIEDAHLAAVGLETAGEGIANEFVDLLDVLRQEQVRATFPASMPARACSAARDTVSGHSGAVR